MFVHNGYIDEWQHIKRDLTMMVSPDLFPEIEGSTNSEVLFMLALTFGLADDPAGAIARMVGTVEETGASPRRRAPAADDGRA